MRSESTRRLAAGSLIGAAIVCLAFAAADAAADESVALTTTCTILLASGIALSRVGRRALRRAIARREQSHPWSRCRNAARSNVIVKASICPVKTDQGANHAVSVGYNRGAPGL